MRYLSSAADKDLLKGSVLGSGLGVGVSAATGGGSQDAIWGSVVGATGQELIEWGLKKSIGRNMSGAIAKQAGDVTIKKSAEVASKRTMLSAVRSGVVGAGKSIGTGASTLLGGPIGVALFVMSVTFALIDMFANPWKNYWNKDLDEMLAGMNEAYAKEMQSFGLTWPLEVKPNLEPETEEELRQFAKDVQEFYKDRGLVSANDYALYDRMRRFEIEQNRIFEMNINQSLDNLARETEHSEFLGTLMVDYGTLQDKVTASSDFVNQQWSNYIYVAMNSTDMETERTMLMLYTALLQKKNKENKEDEQQTTVVERRRSIWLDIRQYAETYWLRMVLMLVSCLISFTACLLNFFYLS